MKGKNVFYVSGGITSAKDGEMDLFNKYTDILRKHGYEVINPLELDKMFPEDESYEDIMIRDLQFILDERPRHILVLDNHLRSCGAKTEIMLAINILGSKVWTQDDVLKLEI